MSFPATSGGVEADPALLTKIAASGCVRTKKDAEVFRDQLVQKGFEKSEYRPLYRAVLALLGDLSALATLQEPEYGVALKAYSGMKANYIGNSECRCLRTATGAVATNLTTCPVHGKTEGARPGMRNLTGLMR